MRGQLSEKGNDLKYLCDGVAAAVATAISSMVGDPKSGAMVNMGADGTPTKSIDRAAEDAVLSKLKESGIGFRVLSEEIGETVIGDVPEYFLHLDPLDGTFNAVRGIPFYSVSIFLTKDDFSFGYVCDLARGLKYYAETDRGAYAEPGGKIVTSRVADLNDFSISAYTIRPNTSRIVRIGDRIRRIRTLGSTSLELCYVASGKLDAFIDVRGMLRAVDVAAGMLIVQEAGGVVTDASNRRLKLNGDMWQRTDLIGSNGLAHQELLELIGGGGH
jgi:fructose-1,6-bisphosphatase/inositol monophosphatase family enzyme